MTWWIIQGAGVMETFWLLGGDDFDKTQNAS